MLSSDENRIRSEEQPSQRLALLVAPFWGIAPWQSSKILHPNSSHGVDPWVVVETSSYSKHILLQKDARGAMKHTKTLPVNANEDLLKEQVPQLAPKTLALAAGTSLLAIP